jgi:HD-like signal output (HDOD) protein
VETPVTARSDRLIRWVMESTGRGQGDLPAFPAVATRLVDLLEHSRADVRDVEALVLQDQAIAAEVLRTANSVLYAGAMPVESVSQAVMRLGFRETAQVAMTAACRALFDMENRAEVEVFPNVWRALWHDSLVCAYGGRLLARELKQGAPERVFLGAMFRNLGGLLVLKIVARGMVRGRLRRGWTEADVGAAIAALHASLGANYLRSCCMPEHVVTIAARHHDLDVPFTTETIDLHLVRLADGLCEQVGVAPFASGELGPLAQESAASLGVDAERIEYFVLQFRELAGQLHSLV